MLTFQKFFWFAFSKIYANERKFESNTFLYEDNIFVIFTYIVLHDFHPVCQKKIDDQQNSFSAGSFSFVFILLVSFSKMIEL